MLVDCNGYSVDVVNSVGTLGGRMIHFLDGMEWDGGRCHYITENGIQFKTYGVFVYGIFHSLFLEWYWLCVAETVEVNVKV